MKRTGRYPASAIAASDGQAIENRQKTVRVEMRPLLDFTNRVTSHLGLHPDSVAIRLINDRQMALLNQTYRHKKGPTDVLSFPAEVRQPPGNLRQRLKIVRDAQLGDIAISPVVAKRNAKRYRRQLTEEIQILILHGILHLLGYDHETDRGEMDQVEIRLRRRLGIA